MSMLDAALELAVIGWHVFPLRTLSKVPATDNGFHDATDDIGAVFDWWTTGNPSSNIGIATGASGLLVLDLDPTNDDDHHCGEAFAHVCALADANGGELPDTFEVLTPRGGEHWYYRLAEGVTVPCSASRLAPHVDVRSTGGYVVAAGSILKNGCYEVSADRPVVDAPGWLIEACQRPVRAPQLPGERNLRVAGMDGTRKSVRRLQGAAGRVATAAEGNRNQTLNWAAHAVAEDVAAGDLSAHEVIAELTHAAMRAGLGEGEAIATIRSGLGAGMGTR